MIFSGFLVLFDPPKAGIADTINKLNHLGVSLKVITGDNKLVAAISVNRLDFRTRKSSQVLTFAQ